MRQAIKLSFILGEEKFSIFMKEESIKCVTCNKPSTLRCPTCLSFNISTFFCSQSCFKSSWKIHRQVHPCNPFPDYKYSGSLRPYYPLSPTRLVPDNIVKPDYAIGSIPLSEMKLRGSTEIPVLNPSEIEIMRNVCKIGRQVLEAAKSFAKVGVKTDDIDKLVHELTIQLGAYPSPLNYHGFPKSVCTSVNEVICHGIPDHYVLKDGDILNIDISCYKDSFHSDLNETVLIGNVDEEGKKLVRVTRECLDLAIAKCKPGMLYRDLGTVIQAHADQNNLSVVRTYCIYILTKAVMVLERIFIALQMYLIMQKIKLLVS